MAKDQTNISNTMCGLNMCVDRATNQFVCTDNSATIHVGPNSLNPCVQDPCSIFLNTPEINAQLFKSIKAQLTSAFVISKHDEFQQYGWGLRTISYKKFNKGCNGAKMRTLYADMSQPGLFKSVPGRKGLKTPRHVMIEYNYHKEPVGIHFKVHGNFIFFQHGVEVEEDVVLRVDFASEPSFVSSSKSLKDLDLFLADFALMVVREYAFKRLVNIAVDGFMDSIKRQLGEKWPPSPPKTIKLSDGSKPEEQKYSTVIKIENDGSCHVDVSDNNAHVPEKKKRGRPRKTPAPVIVLKRKRGRPRKNQDPVVLQGTGSFTKTVYGPFNFGAR